jgi:hypothetical protein
VINREPQHLGINVERLDLEAVVGGCRCAANGIGQLIRDDGRDDLDRPAQVSDVALDVEELLRKCISVGLDIVLDGGWRREVWGVIFIAKARP